MLNHYRPRETKWTYDNNLQAFTITTLQGIRGGEQIFDSYGQKCNHRFLLNYGFAVERNVEQDGFCPNEVPVVVALEELRVGGGGGGENGEEGEDGRHLEDDQGEGETERGEKRRGMNGSIVRKHNQNVLVLTYKTHPFHNRCNISHPSS